MRWVTQCPSYSACKTIIVFNFFFMNPRIRHYFQLCDPVVSMLTLQWVKDLLISREGFFLVCKRSRNTLKILEITSVLKYTLYYLLF